MPAADSLVMIGIEDVVTVPARQFGLIHGLVGWRSSRSASASSGCG